MQNRQNELAGGLNAHPPLKNLVESQTELRSFRQAVRKDWQVLQQKSFTWAPDKTFDWKQISELEGTTTNTIAYFAGQSKWVECQELPSLKSGWTQSFPRIDGSKLQFKKCAPSELVMGPNWNLPEAPENAPSCQPDFIFVPASACDLSGHRIGKGGGYYDQFIRENPECVTCAVLHSRYLFKELPSKWLHPGDQKIQYILTEKNFINIKESSS